MSEPLEGVLLLDDNVDDELARAKRMVDKGLEAREEVEHEM